jgi:hypothetical protein
MTPDQLAIEQTRAAWSAAYAAWIVGGFAAMATLGAVVAAFTLQRRQMTSEAAREARAKVELGSAALDGCARAITQIAIIHGRATSAGDNEGVDAHWSEMVDFALSLVQHFLDRDLANTDVVVCLLNARSILLQAKTAIAQATDGLFPARSVRSHFSMIEPTSCAP